MTIGVLSLLLNLLIVGLLMATISYCWLLNKRIKILQDSKGELANLLKYFDESTTRASETIVALQSASKKIGENIQARMDKVNYLMDDLSFMIEKGNRLADQLDANFAVNRARSRVDNVVTKEPDEAPREKTIERIEQPPPTKNPKEKSAISLESVLDRVIGRTKTVAPKPPANNRSKAEQELLDMIRSGIKG